MTTPLTTSPASPLTRPPAHLLVVDDAPANIRLVQEALRECASTPALRLTVAHDGAEALAMLRRDGAQAGTPRPDLVLLDLNMPRLSGLEVLAALKDDPTLRRIPVVVFSTSAAMEDVRAAYDRGANAYVTKPLDLDHLIAVLRAIMDFWFTVVTLPSA